MPIDRNRFYSAPPATNSLGMTYVWSDAAVITGSANPVTGAWIPATASADGSLNVNITGVSVTASGLEVNTDTLEAITLTGVRYMSGISGQLGASSRSDTPSGYTSYTGMVQMNRAVVTSGYNPQFQSGAPAATAVDNVNGGMLSVLSDLDQSIDSITTYPATATTTSNYVPSGNNGIAIVTGNVLLANPNRIMWAIQNVSSGSSLFVKLGSAPAGTGSFSFLLKPATTFYGADGGIFTDSPAQYRGDVSVSGSTLFSVFEM